MGRGEFSGCPVVKTLTPNAEYAGGIPSSGAKIPHASWLKIYIYIKQNNKFNKEFKNGPHLKTKILKTERNNDKKPAKNTVTDIA